MSLSYQDYVILSIGLGLILWFSRHHISIVWKFIDQPTVDRQTMRTWRIWILLATITVPAVGSSVFEWCTSEAIWALPSSYWIETIPVLGWSVYAAWLPDRKGRWFAIVKYGVVAWFSRELCVISVWFTMSSTDEFQDYYFNFRMIQIGDEILSCLLTLILLSSAARLFRFHLVRVEEAYQEPPRITIPFLLLAQACLALVISVMLWRNQKQAIGQIELSIALQFAFSLTWGLAAAWIAMAWLAPSRLPRWVFAPLLIIGALAGRILVWGWWNLEMQKLNPFPSPLAANQMFSLIGRSLLIEFAYFICGSLLVRMLFHKLGLVVKGLATPTDRMERVNKNPVDNELVVALPGNGTGSELDSEALGVSHLGRFGDSRG